MLTGGDLIDDIDGCAVGSGELALWWLGQHSFVVKAGGKVFPGQPDGAPDGSGPHRVTRMTKDGYTVEIFIPRSIFNVPIFAPGW